MHAIPRPSLPARSCAGRSLALLAWGAASLVIAGTANAAVLYKSIGPNGVIQFSDMPPDNGVIVEERAVRDPSSAGDAFGNPAGTPAEAFENPLQTVADGTGDDTALARANAQVDLAEHALALARRSMWRELSGLHMGSDGRSRTDEERIDFYRRNLKIARANLIDTLRRRAQ